MALTKTLGIPLAVKYQNYKGIPLDMPIAIGEMTPVVGTYIAGATFDEYKETKYIVYNQANPASSPYLDLAATNPFF